MRALIAGAGGQLGRELLRTAPESTSLLAYRREQLDVADSAAVLGIVAQEQPDLVINAAAHTAVDQAEKEPELSFAVNATGAENVAHAATEVCARLIQISTDFVFDGKKNRPYRPDDDPAPISVYGASKLEGERRAAAATGGQALILRTARLYSVFGANFVKTVLGAASSREELEVVADQVGTPTWTKELARAIWSVAALPELAGIHHWTDAGMASWHEFAVAIVEEAHQIGLLPSAAQVLPVTTSARPTGARRPAYSVLDTQTTRQVLQVEPRHWRANLREMLSELKETNRRIASRNAN